MQVVIVVADDGDLGRLETCRLAEAEQELDSARISQQSALTTVERTDRGRASGLGPRTSGKSPGDAC